jgi:SAM-dependent methyltransferase
MIASLAFGASGCFTIFRTRWCSTLFPRPFGWSIGLLHHLPDALVTISEAVRVCRPGGYCAILDAVKPVSYWTRPVTALIRRLDRGEFVRSSEELLSLLSRVGEWRSTRLTYAATGLELLVNIANK